MPVDVLSASPSGQDAGGWRVAIVQSNYIPWKGYFDLIDTVDEFVLLDEVQYTPRNWRNRNLIKTASGLRWLTIPVHTKGRRFQRIDETLIHDRSWARSHWSSIAQSYREAPYFDFVAATLTPLYRRAAEFERLSEVNHAFMIALCEMLGVKTRISWSTDYPSGGGLNERLLALCQATGADTYVSGPSARPYIDVELFERGGVEVAWFDYTGYGAYPQLHGPLTHHVSVVDLLFCAGPTSRRLFKAAQQLAVS